MKTAIKIGSKEVEMVANAASPFVYRQIFKKDFFSETQKPEVDVNVFVEMGFVMSLQASKHAGELMKTSLDEFYVWLEQFDQMDMINAMPAIGEFYTSQEKTTSVPKNEAG